MLTCEMSIFIHNLWICKLLFWKQFSTFSKQPLQSSFQLSSYNFISRNLLQENNSKLPKEFLPKDDCGSDKLEVIQMYYKRGTLNKI